MQQSKINQYQTRNGDILHFRYYSADSNNVMILLHGITADSQYLNPLAEFVANENLAHVYTPDLRGYGQNQQKRGDLDYIGQHEDDLMDLLKYIKDKHHDPKIIMAGHSAGGGTTLRMAASKYKNEIDRYLFLAPFIHPLSPTVPKNNPNSTGTAKLGKLILLYVLNGLKITSFNQLIVYMSNQPKESQHESKTSELSFRLFISRFPAKYTAALQAIDKPALVIVGDKDEEFVFSQYEPLFSKYTKAKTKVIPNVNHDSILSAPATFSFIKEWLTGQN